MNNNPLFPASILYGSQTGNGESIGKEIYKLWLENNIINYNNINNSLYVGSMLDYLKHDENLDKLSNNRIIIFIISTTGSGELPDNAVKFVRKLKQATTNSGNNFLSNTLYCILGLGDSGYDKYCEAANKLNDIIIKTKANKLLDMHKADDAIG